MFVTLVEDLPKQLSSAIISLFQNDLLVISCDLLTNFDLNLLMRVHRNNNSSFTALFSEASELKYVPGQKEKQKQGKNWQQSSTYLLYFV